MKYIFVDTNAWLAINNKKDQYNSIAVRVNKKLLKEGCRYITTNFILDETITGLLKVLGHTSAVDFGERIYNSKLIEIIHINKEIERLAWELFKKYNDKEFSFTDCTSFIIMRQNNITDVFTNDHHFEQMGYIALLKTFA